MAKRKTVPELLRDLQGVAGQIRSIEQSCGGNWRNLRRIVTLRERQEHLKTRIKKMGVVGEAAFTEPLDTETVAGFYQTVDTLNEFELRAIVRGLCLSHERLRLGVTPQ